MKKLSELTIEEVRSLLASNKWMKERAEEWAQESAEIVVSDILRPFNRMHGVDYNIGYPADRFEVGYPAYKEFLFACSEHEYKEWIFGDMLAKIERATDRVHFFENCLYDYEDISAANYDRLEKWLSDIVEEAARAIVYACNEEYAHLYDDDARAENA